MTTAKIAIGVFILLTIVAAAALVASGNRSKAEHKMNNEKEVK